MHSSMIPLGLRAIFFAHSITGHGVCQKILNLIQFDFQVIGLQNAGISFIDRMKVVIKYVFLLCNNIFQNTCLLRNS